MTARFESATKKGILLWSVSVVFRANGVLVDSMRRLRKWGVISSPVTSAAVTMPLRSTEAKIFIDRGSPPLQMRQEYDRYYRYFAVQLSQKYEQTTEGMPGCTHIKGIAIPIPIPNPNTKQSGINGACKQQEVRIHLRYISPIKSP